MKKTLKDLVKRFPRPEKIRALSWMNYPNMIYKDATNEFLDRLSDIHPNVPQDLLREIVILALEEGRSDNR